MWGRAWMPKEVALGQEAGQDAGDIRRYPEKTPNKALEMRCLQLGCGRLPLLLSLSVSQEPFPPHVRHRRNDGNVSNISLYFQSFTVFPI